VFVRSRGRSQPKGDPSYDLGAHSLSDRNLPPESHPHGLPRADFRSYRVSLSEKYPHAGASLSGFSEPNSLNITIFPRSVDNGLGSCRPAVGTTGLNDLFRCKADVPIGVSQLQQRVARGHSRSHFRCQVKPGLLHLRALASAASPCPPSAARPHPWRASG